MSYFPLSGAFRMVPTDTYTIVRGCAGCGGKSTYRCADRFRVNANGKRLDVWLIYRCERCKHTYNLPVYSRVLRDALSAEEYRALLANDPGYLASLASMPEAEKQALLYGSWDSFSGQVFTEWRNDPAHYEDQRWTHVIAPFTIPKHWQLYRGFDFGFSKPFSVGWYAADEEGRLYRIKELYGCTGRPNEGLRIDPVEQARRIREAEQNDPLLRGRVIHGIADPAIFDESRGESIAAMMERSPNFLRCPPATTPGLRARCSSTTG